MLFKYKLAIFLSNPIQYKVHLLKKLSTHPNIDLYVYFYSDTGIRPKSNPYHGMAARWDIPLFDGYRYEFLKNMINDENWKSKNIGPYVNPEVISRSFNSNFDSIIVHSYLYPSDWFAWSIGKIKGSSRLFYGDMYPRSSISKVKNISKYLISKRMILGADACLAIGTLAKEVYVNEYNVLEKKIFLAPYAVDNSSFIQASEKLRPNQSELKRNLLGIAPEIPVVLCVAGMVPVKRHTDLIDAMVGLSIPAHLVLVGDGPLFNQVKDYAEENYPDTTLTGFINQSELPNYYASADVFVLPSESDVFGLVINEAMCFDLPVITTNRVGASKDLIVEGENGFIYEVGNIKQLTQYLQIILSDNSKQINFGTRSKEIISTWNYDRTVDGIMDALEYVSGQ